PAVDNLRKVSPGVDLNFEVVGGFSRGRHGDDLDRLPCREHSIHAGSADSDSLLAAAHSQSVELRAVEQLAEDQRDLLPDDAWPVILHAEHRTYRSGRL